MYIAVMVGIVPMVILTAGSLLLFISMIRAEPPNTLLIKIHIGQLNFCGRPAITIQLRHREMNHDPVTTLIEGEPRSVWIRVGTLKIYIRTNGRWLNETRVKMFEIANVDNTGKKGNGDFKAFLNDVESRKPFDGIYIENVLTERFAKFFLNNGYIPHEYINCYYKLW